MGFIVSTVVDDVANHSRNDIMHTPLPMSNYLRGGCAKRWDALINQGKSQLDQNCAGFEDAEQLTLGCENLPGHSRRSESSASM